jgi:hypothetical protein
MIADERGIALAMVLILSAITLGIMAGLVYMITSGTMTSETVQDGLRSKPRRY